MDIQTNKQGLNEPATYSQRKLLVRLSKDGRYFDEPMTKGEAGRNIQILKNKNHIQYTIN